ncbi:fam-l protein [Plasmodium malariae]|uniref:Fam-l protein n=1 Tax=Plasmodium malariae TaxID=5858 RepID=A0A1D3JHH9_PLAMA|nr:fam-l protein [Plasmodium malariae]SBT85807.1 fam-l protein [Plasmodium malariae]
MMEKSIKIPLFIKISLFIFLNWTCHFNNDVCKPNKNLENNYILGKKLSLKSYRILARSKEFRGSCYVALNQNLKDNKIQEEKYFFNNQKGFLEKRKQLNGSLSKNERCNKKVMKNNYNIFETKKYSRLEKKIFKELDYIDFLKNDRIISDKVYKKVIRKKFGLRIFIPVLLLFIFLLSIILDFSGSYGLRNGLFQLFKITSLPWHGKINGLLHKSPIGEFFKGVVKEFTKQLGSQTQKVRVINYSVNFTNFLIYFIPFIILGVTLILWVFYYHKKVKKYEKIKYGKR